MHGLTDTSVRGATDAGRSATPCWTAAQLDQLQITPATTLPLIDTVLPRPLLPGLDLWDMWPLQRRDGTIAHVANGEIWFILSAPILPDPDLRHGIARIRLVSRRDGVWTDLGNAFPDDFTPGSREWAGSAVLSDDNATITLYFTAAGTRGDARNNWQQRIFAATGRWRDDTARPAIEWQAPTEILRADGRHYQRVTPDVGRAGFIKGFRDPAWFCDPADGCEYLLFTGSLVGVASAWDGAVGIARRVGDGWALLPPLLSMAGVNNEPERPHVVHHDGRYYLFWSTQTRMFAPGITAGPNGLYAMVADSMVGPWLPMNGSGLVAANPPTAPHQAYSWWVTAELAVYGFADMIGTDTVVPVDTAQWRRDHFAGVPAPEFSLKLAGATSSIVPLR